MEYTVKALAELSGVTPRALRWYDAQGLLKPLRATPAGYRIYGPGEVDRLQQILFYRELGFSLAEIRALLDDPGFDRQRALQSHLAALEARRARLDGLILTVKHTLDDAKGEKLMTDSEKFEAFKRNVSTQNEDTYGAEVRAKYGDTAADRANAQVMALSREEYGRREALGRDILDGLSAAVRAGADPAGPEGRRLAELHRDWLSTSWGQPYTPQAHAGLAALYTEDARFTEYYDREIPGCAAFLRAAVEAYTQSLAEFSPRRA